MSQDLFEEFASRLTPRDAPRASLPTGGTAPTRPPRVKKKRSELPENQVESQIVSFLEARRWFVEKVHVGVFVPWYSLEALWRKGIAIVKGMLPGGTVTRIGTAGDPDYRAWRPRAGGGVDLFLVEVKGEGKKPTPEQIARMRELKLTGAVVEWFNDFDFGGPHSFLEFYKKTFMEA